MVFYWWKYKVTLNDINAKCNIICKTNNKNIRHNQKPKLNEGMKGRVRDTEREDRNLAELEEKLFRF